MRGSAKEMVNYRRHPFYERNSCQTFLAYRDGEVCGRIAAILNQGHNVHYNERRGFFGFFDCIDDQQAANGLFDAVRQWFDDQGIHRLRGPTNPSLNYELGLLIDGFDSPPVFMMTYNPPYYQRLIENYGFRKSQDMFAFWGHVEMLPAISAKLGPIAEQIIERYDVKLRNLDRSHFQQDVEMFLDLYNRSLMNTWGFVPMTAGEVKRLAGELKQIIVPGDGGLRGGRRPRGRGGLRPARLQPANQEDRRPALPLRLHPSVAQPPGDQAHPRHQHQRLPEYQRMGIGTGADARTGAQGVGMGHRRGGVLLGARIESPLLRALKKGGAKITKTYRLYDLDEEGREERERGEGE